MSNETVMPPGIINPLKSIEDLGQLRAMLIGKDDTLDYQRSLISALTDSLKVRENSVSELKQQVGTQNLLIEEKDEAFANLTQQVTALKASLTRSKNTAGGLRQEVAAHKTSLKGAENSVSDLTQEVAALKTSLKGSKNTASDLRQEVATLKTSLEGSEKSVGDYKQEVGTLKHLLKGNEESVKELTLRVGLHKNALEVLEKTALGYELEVGSLKYLLRGNEESVKELTQRVALLKASAKESEDAASDLTQEVTALKTSLEVSKNSEKDLKQEVGSLKYLLRGNEDSVKELTQQNSDKNDKIKKLEYSRNRLTKISGNHRIYNDTQINRSAEVAELERDCLAMRKIMKQAPEIYQPSLFWEKFYEINMAQLREVGLSNFKLTVNQNYQNFIPRTLLDPKLRPLLKWFRKNPSFRPLLSVMTNPDGIAPDGYFSLPETQIFHDDPNRLAMFRTLVTLGWEYCRAHDPLNLCDRLEEPEIGNPIRVVHGGKLISQDLAISATEVRDLVEPLQKFVGDKPFSVLEIGGGYGRFPHALFSTQPVEKYIIVDIPPALHVSYWYLEKLFPDKKFFRAQNFTKWSSVAKKIDQADFVFLLPHQIELLPDEYVDACVATSSLHEMTVDQANNYLKHMGRLSRHLICSKHYWSYVNPYDDFVFKHDQYHTPDGFKSTNLKSDALNPVFFVETFERS